MTSFTSALFAAFYANKPNFKDWLGPLVYFSTATFKPNKLVIYVTFMRPDNHFPYAFDFTFP